MRSSSRKKASVRPSGESAALTAFSTTTSGVPLAAPTDQIPSCWRASDAKKIRLPSGDENGLVQSLTDVVRRAAVEDEGDSRRVKICRTQFTSAAYATVCPSGEI